MYLLEKMTEPGTCKACPEETTICYGGNLIGPKPGYWRKNSTSENFIACPNYPACLGISPPSYNPKGDCLYPYKGVLCTICEPGYSSTGTFECSACPEHGKNAVRLFFIGVAAILAVVYLVRSTMKGAKDERNITSVFFKIMMNHLSMLLLTASFDFEWPDQVQGLFSVAAPISEVSEQLFSVDCFLSNGENASTNATTDSEDLVTDESLFNVFYMKLMMMAALPFLVFAICYAVWYIIGLIQKTLHLTKDKAISTLVIVLFLVHPNIVQYMFDVFNCFNVDTEMRVYENLSIICYLGNWNLYAYGVALPGIVLWGLGIPFFAFALLTRERKKLHLLSIREKYGFLYRGYKK
mmetsp:Transcript_20833/g.19878  ORF Transcript_20833/g.19878 Transcript_20833/m.19878 type:complete len:352 (-) Transcript_20833:1622-2677(-)